MGLNDKLHNTYCNVWYGNLKWWNFNDHYETTETIINQSRYCIIAIYDVSDEKWTMTPVHLSCYKMSV